jgi:hypothetical protein
MGKQKEKKMYKWLKTSGGKYTYVYLHPEELPELDWPDEAVDIFVAYISCSSRYGESKIKLPKLFELCPFSSIGQSFHHPDGRVMELNRTSVNPMHEGKKYFLSAEEIGKAL